MTVTEILTYIQNNSLPCKAVIDATDINNINISGSTFTLRNLFNNDTTYDFLQTTVNDHPTFSNNSISFNDSDNLTIRNNPFSENTKSYTLILCTKGNDFTSNQILDLNKKTNNLPSFLDYIYSSNKLKQQFSLNRVEGDLEINSNFSSQLNIAISHNNLYGITNINLNNTQTYSYLNLDKGYFNILEIDKLYLGNSYNRNKPFLQKFRFLLLFIPAISNVAVEYILNLIPPANIVWNDLEFDMWNNISTDDWDNVE